MMKSKMSVLVLVGSFFVAAVGLLSALFIMLQTGTLSKRTAGIALPSEGGYVEAWTQHLPQIAREVNIPEVTIYTYDSFSQLKTIFNQPDKFNLLWAEIPVTGEYNLKTLLDDVPTVMVNDDTRYSYPPALYDEILKIAGQKNIRFLPLSYNPWIIVRNNESVENPEFEYAVGANSPNGALAALALARKIKGTGNNFLSVDDGLKALNTMVNDRTFILNPGSYTNKDVLFALDDNKAKKALWPVEYFNSLSVAQRLAFSVEPFTSGLIADATVAVFPVRKSDEAKEAVMKAKTLLMNTELMYSTANGRNWMPAHIGTVSRSMYTDYVRNQSRYVSKCIIPGMQYESDKDKEEFMANLNAALRSDYSNYSKD